MRETHTKHSPSQTYYNTHEGSFNLIKEETYESMLFIGAIFAIAALCGK